MYITENKSMYISDLIKSLQIFLDSNEDMPVYIATNATLGYPLTNISKLTIKPNISSNKKVCFNQLLVLSNQELENE